MKREEELKRLMKKQVNFAANQSSLRRNPAVITPLRNFE